MTPFRHFTRAEFMCKCGCGFQTVDAELLAVLEDLRDMYQRPVRINSGCRCPQWNKQVGGEEGSEHLRGTAADIAIEGVATSGIYNYLIGQYPGKYGIGLYPTWVHIDVRQRMARWSKL